MTTRSDKPSILIGLIHCYNQGRLDYIRPQLAEWVSSWSGYHPIQVIEIAYQPPSLDASGLPNFRQCMARQALFSETQHKWLNYIETPNLALKHHINRAWHALQYARLNTDGRAQYKKRQWLEWMVSDKHIRAWDVFLDSGHDLLIILEDDAIFSGQSLERLRIACDTALAMAPDTGLYADLAGGYPLNQLHIGSLILGQSNGMTTFSKPVTNTACGYMCNQPMIQDWKRTLCHHPRARQLSADWVMNHCIMAAHRRIPVSCFHMTPSALTHGSIAGMVPSWGIDYYPSVGNESVIDTATLQKEK